MELHRSTAPEGCPICDEPPPADVIADLPSTWITAPHVAPLPGYVCVVSKPHAVEPFELSPRERRAFWDEVNLVAKAIATELQPKKLNYEIHGNTIPHLHLHLYPRYAGDRFEGRPIEASAAVPRTESELERLRRAIALLLDAPTDPYASQKDLGWRDIAAIDASLERGDIDEATWHAEMAGLIVPAYLAAGTPWEGSGKSGGAPDWEYARSHIAHAIDRDGSFLDVGCANGYLLECIPRWTPHQLDRYGLDIAPELVEHARRRLPALAERLHVGNVLEWTPSHRFTFVRTGLEYVPLHRRRDLVERLLGWCERLIIGVYSEEVEARPTEELLQSWGLRVAGRSERANRGKPEVDYRVLWIDASRPLPPPD